MTHNCLLLADFTNNKVIDLSPGSLKIPHFTNTFVTPVKEDLIMSKDYWKSRGVENKILELSEETLQMMVRKCSTCTTTAESFKRDVLHTQTVPGYMMAMIKSNLLFTHHQRSTNNDLLSYRFFVVDEFIRDVGSCTPYRFDDLMQLCKVKRAFHVNSCYPGEIIQMAIRHYEMEDVACMFM